MKKEMETKVLRGIKQVVLSLAERTPKIAKSSDWNGRLGHIAVLIDEAIKNYE